MSPWRGPILLGLVLAAGLGVLAALLLAPGFDPHADVVLKTCSEDPTQRAHGWELAQALDWNRDQRTRLAAALIAGPADARREAAEHPWFEPVAYQWAFAEIIAPSNPRRALAWMAGEDALPLAQWKETAGILLSSPQEAIRGEALAIIVPRTDSPRELLPLHEAIHPEGVRERGILRFAAGLEATTPQSLLEEAGVRFEDEADTQRIDDAARQVIRRKRSDIEVRRYAAWRIDELDDGTTAGLLAPAPADGDGSILVTAMIAQRHLSPLAAADLLERWLIDHEVDRRRAAALLAVLLDAEAAPLAAALAREKDPAARRTMSLALAALGAWPHQDISQAEYAARTMRLEDGRLDPDSAFLRMLAGDPGALAAIGTHPRLPSSNLSEEDRARWRRAIQWRQWALAWMVPQWHDALGEPVAGDQDGLLKRLDMIEALRLTSSRHLAWDPAARQWRGVAHGEQEYHDQP